MAAAKSASRKPRATKKTTRAKRTNPFQPRKPEEAGRERESQVHVYGPKAVCETERRGHATPGGRSLHEIVVDASEGFIPLWAYGQTLRWRFRRSSMTFFQNQTAAMNEVRNLLGEALVAWGDAAPVKFTEQEDNWDFEIVMKAVDNCDINGCVLASAFFPDQGQHKLNLYPQMFAQSRQEQIETLMHEIGHVFGLRHFFADISERAWPSQIFGTHNPFSIMNYGSQSVLTDADRSDLKTLYQLAWSGELTDINSTPVRLVKPFHTLSEFFSNGLANGAAAASYTGYPKSAFAGRPR
jgi:hypothetical protein